VSLLGDTPVLLDSDNDSCFCDGPLEDVSKTCNKESKLPLCVDIDTSCNASVTEVKDI
jgi:hypothetical protein